MDRFDLPLPFVTHEVAVESFSTRRELNIVTRIGPPIIAITGITMWPDRRYQVHPYWRDEERPEPWWYGYRSEEQLLDLLFERIFES